MTKGWRGHGECRLPARHDLNGWAVTHPLITRSITIFLTFNFLAGILNGQEAHSWENLRTNGLAPQATNFSPILRGDISIDSFQGREDHYLVSFEWEGKELHTFGRAIGDQSALFSMRNNQGKTIGFLTFTFEKKNTITIKNGGTAGKYRNLGYGLPLLDSFASIAIAIGMTNIETTIGRDNPFVLMLIANIYGFGPINKDPENAMMIAPSQVKQHVFPVHYIGEKARKRIEHSPGQEPDPFGPSYKEFPRFHKMLKNSTTVYVGETTYHIIDRSKFVQRIIRFVPKLKHHPNPLPPPRQIIWNSPNLSAAIQISRAA